MRKNLQSTRVHTRVMSNIKKKEERRGNRCVHPWSAYAFWLFFPTLKGLASVHSKAIFEIEMIANKEAVQWKLFFQVGESDK